METEAIPLDGLDPPSIGEIIDTLQKMGCKVELCGSRVTCDPVRDESDWDYLVEVSVDPDLPSRVRGAKMTVLISEVVDYLGNAGFSLEGGEHYQLQIEGNFMSMRRGEFNLLVSGNVEWVRRHRAATHVCKRLNLLHKPDRIALFQAVLYGVQWTDEMKKPKAEPPPKECPF